MHNAIEATFRADTVEDVGHVLARIGAVGLSTAISNIAALYQVQTFSVATMILL